MSSFEHACAVEPGASQDVDQLKRKLLERINNDRRQAGLRPVLLCERLSEAADLHCLEMLAEGYTSHWNRAGLKPYMRYSLSGLTDHTAENISGVMSTSFDTSTDSVERELLERHQDFMAEEAPLDWHRQTVLDRAHTHVGIGLDRFRRTKKAGFGRPPNGEELFYPVGRPLFHYSGSPILRMSPANPRSTF